MRNFFLQKQADVNTGLLFLGLLCHLLPLMFKHSMESNTAADNQILQLSRASSIVMLLSYTAYLFFQLKTHRELFEAEEVFFFFYSIWFLEITCILIESTHHRYGSLVVLPHHYHFQNFSFIFSSNPIYKRCSCWAKLRHIQRSPTLETHAQININPTCVISASPEPILPERLQNSG